MKGDGPPVFILARNGREAAAVAREQRLTTTGWALFTQRSGRGLTGARVLKTPCWHHGRPGAQIEMILANLRIGGADVREVPCPYPREPRE